MSHAGASVDRFERTEAHYYSIVLIETNRADSYHLTSQADPTCRLSNSSEAKISQIAELEEKGEAVDPHRNGKLIATASFTRERDNHCANGAVCTNIMQILSPRLQAVTQRHIYFTQHPIFLNVLIIIRISKSENNNHYLYQNHQSVDRSTKRERPK